MRNETRSSNGELAEGMSDGLYKKVETDRGGVVGSETWESRRHLSQRDYGIQEAKEKVLPDGSVHITPGYVETPTPLLGLSAW
jgi:hypothetical protein